MTSFLAGKDVFLTVYDKNYYKMGVNVLLKSFIGSTNQRKIVPLIVLENLKKILGHVVRHF